MNYQEFLQSIQVWGYPLMFFLMIVEGPIATVTAAFLASLGFFNWSIVLLLSIIGDLIGDTILYFIGYSGGHPIMNKLKKIMRSKSKEIERLEDRFHKSSAKIIFYVKTTTGLSWIAFIIAGIVRMPFRRFMLFSFLGGIFWSGLLVGLGYFFGYAASTIERYLKFAGWAIFLIAMFVIFYIYTFRKKRAKKLFWRKLNGNRSK